MAKVLIETSARHVHLSEEHIKALFGEEPKIVQTLEKDGMNQEAQKNGTLEECFGTGTAAVISPVGKLRYVDEVMSINGGEIGALSQKLYDTITGIQLGRLPDENGWRVKVGK